MVFIQVYIQVLLLVNKSEMFVSILPIPILSR